MKIGLDAHALGSQLGGNETYMRNLVRALPRVDPDGDYTLFLASERLGVVPEEAALMRRVVVRPRAPLLRIPVSFPLALAREKIDVVHVQYFAPPLCPARVVAAVHDIAYEHYPEFFTPNEVRRFRLLVPWTMRRARTIVTLSEFSRQDIVRRYNVSSERVVVTPLAADPVYRKVEDRALLSAVRERYGVDGEFILCVGNLQPRKNVKRLIEAYVRLRRAGAIGHRLVLVGRKAWLYDDTFAAARDSGYGDDLIFTGYVPDEDLVLLYNAAALFVYPSLFEGFGLPPLEAMACGTAVITSNTSALPETVGDAALTVDPFDVEALSSAIGRVARDASLRERLARDGLRRASQFSWERSTRLLQEVYIAAGS